MNKHETIIHLNDQLRIHHEGGTICESPQISLLTKLTREVIMLDVKRFNHFPVIDDEPNEHNWGSLMVQGHPLNWKINCYDDSLKSPSIDPSDPAVTKRILTIRTAIEAIAELNDEFRLSICGAEVKKSPNIAQLNQDVREEIYAAIREFDRFENNSNPHPEHEFGVMEVQGHHLNWLIKYFDKEGKGYSPDPCDPALTKRVMTISTVAETSAQLNDELRIHGVRGQVVLTNGVTYLKQDERSAILQAVHEFTDFNENNDPYGEHDFGSVTVNGHHAFWKIDSYDESFEYGSEEPCDQTVTNRVLTIMMASEY